MAEGSKVFFPTILKSAEPMWVRKVLAENRVVDWNGVSAVIGAEKSLQGEVLVKALQSPPSSRAVKFSRINAHSITVTTPIWWAGYKGVSWYTQVVDGLAAKAGLGGFNGMAYSERASVVFTRVWRAVGKAELLSLLLKVERDIITRQQASGRKLKGWFAKKGFFEPVDSVFSDDPEDEEEEE